MTDASGDNNLHRGATGSKVEALQKSLYKLGYYLGATGPECNGVDGIFGGKTEDAVKAFQRAHHDPDGIALKVDGIVGYRTKWSIEAILDNLSMLNREDTREIPATVELLTRGGIDLVVNGPSPCKYRIHLVYSKMCNG